MFRSVALFGAVIVFVAGFAGTRLAHGLKVIAQPTASAPAQPASPLAMMVAPPAAARAELLSDRFGHFHADVEVDGHTTRMLVDTGASLVALTNEDADALGVVPFPSEYKVRMQTANGTGFAARRLLHRLRIGGVEVDDVDAVVMAPGAATQSLLGMSFLKRLNGFEAKGNRLVLEQ